MAITVNGVEITDAMIQAELPHHDDAPNAHDATVQELILRELLLQTAKLKAWTPACLKKPSANCCRPKWPRRQRPKKTAKTSMPRTHKPLCVANKPKPATFCSPRKTAYLQACCAPRPKAFCLS